MAPMTQERAVAAVEAAVFESDSNRSDSPRSGPVSTGSFGAAAAAPGDTICARYRVVRELGAGGMGQVLEVEHRELRKRFALKLIRPDRWDSALEARFRREALALAQVNSVRVAQVTDFGVDEVRGPFYVMELVDGEPLSELLRRSTYLPRQRALELAIGIAKALVDVHEAGIVHRDIKPANIGVCLRGPVTVRLLDFGLATSTDDRFSSLTDEKRVVGSMPYMAPEQFHGEAPSPQMDIWALGVVLYEMLAGRLPFEAESTPALIHRILSEPPSPLPPEQRTGVVSRLLVKDVGVRPRSASQALDILQEAISGRESRPSAATAEATRVVAAEPAAPSTAKGRSLHDRWGKALVTSAFVALTAVLAWALLRPTASVDPTATTGAASEEASPNVDAPPRATELIGEAPEAAETFGAPRTQPPPSLESEPEPEATSPARTDSVASRPRRRRSLRRRPRRRAPSTDVVENVVNSEAPWDGTIIESPLR